MAKSRTRGRRRKNARRPKISKAKRRAAALKGWRRKRRKNPARGRRRNKPGLFKSRQRTSKRVGMSRFKRGRKRGRYTRSRNRRTTRRQTLWSHPGPRLAAKRRRKRRRNPNGFIGDLMKGDTWMNAGQIALGAAASSILAGRLYGFAPAALQTEGARMIGRPAAIAVSGALIGWGASAIGQKRLGKKLALGGIIAAALDVVTQITQRMGFAGMGDYIQLQGYGTQAQVEAGVFGYGTQAQVEAGDFSDYIQLQGLGHSEEAMSAAQTFGPTF